MSLEEKTRARLEAIFQAYYQELYKFAISQVKNPHDAEDIVQQVAYNFSNVYSKKYFASDAKLKRYLLTILDNKIRNYWRDKKRENNRVTPTDTLPERLSITLEDEVFSKYNAELICRCINEMSGPYGTYLKLALDQETPEDIALVLNVKVSSLRSYASRARDLLKKACEENEIEVGKYGKRK